MLKTTAIACEFVSGLKKVYFSFACETSKLWNELPDDMSSETSLQSFSKKLKAF